MAFIQDILIDYTISDLQTVSITDATDCTDGDLITDINGIRLLFSTVNSVAEATSATTCESWVEYIVTSGVAISNGISYAVGDTMLFANDVTPTGTFTMETTGRYSQYISNVLPSAGLPYTFTPTQVGRTTYNDSYFYDEVFILDYEQYETEYIAGATLAAGTYLVVGTAGASVVVNSTKTVYVGETYVSAGSETFTGASTMVLYSDEAQFSFATQYQNFNTYQSYLAAMGESNLPNEPLQANLLQVAALFASPTIAAQTTTGISLTQLQDNIDQINNYYSLQLN
jgi:hypothetical protein